MTRGAAAAVRAAVESRNGRGHALGRDLTAVETTGRGSETDDVAGTAGAGAGVERGPRGGREMNTTGDE